MESFKFKVVIVFLLAFLTGVNFVMFPALTPILINPDFFGLSTTQFGSLFVPQVVFIAVGCLFSPFLTHGLKVKKLLIIGIGCMIVSTVFLGTFYAVFQHEELIAKSDYYYILLILVSLMGLGFGISITILNPLAASLFQNKKTSAILILQFLVGLGTSTAPLLMFFIKDLQNWVYIPIIMTIIMLLGVIIFSLFNVEENQFFDLPKQLIIPKSLWFFIFIIVLYGLLEGTFGSFGTVFLQNKGLASNWASLGLSLFWAGIAINRMLIGILSIKKDLSKMYIFSPLVVSFVLILFLWARDTTMILTIMFVIGFFMGSIFPGSIGWATREFPQLSVLVSGFLMTANQLGTGLSTNILGAYSKRLSFTEIMIFLSVVSIFIFILIGYLNKNSKTKGIF